MYSTPVPVSYTHLDVYKRQVAGLPADVREAVILRFAYRLKFKEIAVVQGVAARTAQARVRRGIQWLKAVSYTHLPLPWRIFPAFPR